MHSRQDSRPDEWVSFSFERQRLRVKKGQPLAMALFDHGIVVLGRSFKFHRPRGYYCGRGYCNHCALTVDGLPNVLSCQYAVQGGETVSRERGWPSARHDVLASLGLFQACLRPGFQGHLFPQHPMLARLALRLVGKLAGAHHLPDAAAAKAQIKSRAVRHADVLVVGGGRSGRQAALGAASTGARVLLIQNEDAPDGTQANDQLVASASEGGQTPPAQRLRETTAIERIQGTALGYFEDGVVPVLSEDRTFEVHANKLILATGTYDSPGLFEGNDKPNVVLADGVARLLATQDSCPWTRAVVVTDCARGHVLASRLQGAGVTVALIVDQSEAASRDGAHREALAQASATVVEGHLRSVTGLRRARRVAVDTPQGLVRHEADLVCVVLKPRPADALSQQWKATHPRYETRVSDEIELCVSPDGASTLTVVGRAAAWPDSSAARLKAFAAGRTIASMLTSDAINDSRR